jgi:transcriptional regulator with XRE-family HTH domain
MLSETLTAGLEQYRIGPKIRALRLSKKLGLVQLGEHTGLSPAMLSKIERGQLFPTLPTLLRIALVFGVGLEHFFLEEERPAVAVVRKCARLRLPDLSGEEAPAYFFESLDFPVTERRMESFYAEFPVRSKPSKPHEHGSAEFIYVIEGQLVVTVGDTDHVLDEGDAMHFDSSVPHGYRRESRSMCTALVVVAP